MLLKKTAIPLMFLVGLVSLTTACQAPGSDDAVDPMTEEAPTEQPSNIPADDPVDDPATDPATPAPEGTTAPEAPPATTP
ncbi:MAG: hypothetical protein ACTS3T_19715 [Almyronema sp.]